MTSGASEEQFRALECTFWDAMQNRQSAAATRLSDEQCLVAGPQGIMQLDRKTLAAMIDRPPYDLKRYSLDDKVFHVRQVADDLVLVAYKVSEELAVEGKPVHIEAFDTSVWWRPDGGGDWVCVLHTETPAGDPFGR